ncbi:hypothetical protein D3C80_807800 [compost metagenome]
MPAKQATRWMAPAAPVFAGAPAPTGTAPAPGFVPCLQQQLPQPKTVKPARPLWERVHPRTPA